MRISVSNVLLLLFVLTPAAPAREDLRKGPELSTSVDPRSGKLRLRVSGLDAGSLAKIVSQDAAAQRWATLCEVHVLPAGTILSEGHPPVIGSYAVEADSLVFTPKYPISLDDLLHFRCLLDASLAKDADRLKHKSVDPSHSGSLILDLDHSTRKPDHRPRAATKIEAVFPSALVLPENLLKFYVHFSAPMSRREAYRHIRLLDPRGDVVPDPFLELDEELWSPDGRRFTLLFDPGRIKRGLKPREEVGPVLLEGGVYTLVIDESWPDATGRPLESAYRRSLRVGPPDNVPPDPHNWTLNAPRAGSDDPLRVESPEPLDHALALRLISVRDRRGQLVEGAASLEAGETRWEFRPRAPWKPGDYQLVIGTELEDLAGNSVDRPFEVDMVGPISRKIASGTVSLPVRIGPPSR